MLKLARLRGTDLLDTGSLKPRKDGPLIEDGLSTTERGESCDGPATTWAVLGAAATGTGWDSADLGAEAANSDAPHMPQKRFCSEFSFPQRAQRTNLSLPYSLRYLTGSMQGVAGQFGRFLHHR
jgi:hypothetical protein